MADLRSDRSRLTPEQQAALDRWLERAPAGARQAIERRPDQGPAPLSSAQERLWFIDRLWPGATVYCLPTLIGLAGRLDEAVLQRTLAEIVRRHEPLRTRFPTREGRAVQLIEAPAPPPPHTIDLSAFPAERREAELHRLALQATRRPFDLAVGPLLRVLLFRMDETEHRLLVLVHHIVADAWSVRILVEELAAIYGAFSAGRPSALPDLAVSYADFAAWEAGRLREGAMDAHLDYWRDRLQGPLPALGLPFDRPRSPAQGGAGRSHRRRLPEGLGAGLRELGRRAGATPYMTFLAAFLTLLHRYTGETDLVVGTALAARGRVELERMIGFFANTVVMRTDLSGDPTFGKLLTRVRETALGAFTHAEAPFARVVDVARPSRDASRTPLFQVQFVVQDVSLAAVEAGELTIRTLPFDLEAAQFDLTLVVMGEVCRFEYSTDLFDESTIARLAEHFETLLQGVVAGPDRRLSELPSLPADEERRLLVTWNDTRRPYPDGACVHELFERQAARTPDALAVLLGDERLTYSELDRRANRLAHLLRRRGVGPGSLVGICAERSLEMVVAIYGVLKAGAGYVPLDPTLPVERMRYMLERAGAPLLLTQRRLVERVSELGSPLVALDDLDPSLPDSAPSNAARPDDVAYVMYTSGSTGRPKGVMTTHRGLVVVLSFLRDLYRYDPSDRVLQHLPFSFDMSDGELFLPLVTGAAVVLVEPGRQRDLGHLLRVGREREVTSVQFVPTVLPLLLERPELAEWTSLRQLLSGGDVLTAEVLNRLLERDGLILHNFYGPTETTMGTTYWRCRPMRRGTIAPIGRPIPNTTAYVLDHWLRPAPVGVAGELYVGGASLARGYLEAPDLTSERFLPDPFAGEPGARMYRTGDAARWLTDGELEFLGRVDHQVKLRGFRIEPGEIQAALERHPEVGQSLAMVRDDGRGPALTAYVVARDGRAPTSRELHGFLAEWLPEYMIPSAFVVLDAFPLSATGKVDRQALPAPESPGSGGVGAAPASAIERAIAEAWREALGLEGVATEDSFFDLGGHSLLLVQVQSRLERALGRRIALIDLFEHPTVRALADHLGGSGEAPGEGLAERSREQAQRQRAAIEAMTGARRSGGG